MELGVRRLALFDTSIIGLLVLSACRSGPPETLDATHAAAIEDSVRQLATSIARDLAQDGPAAWSAYFLDGPEFFMASDGELVFPDVGAAEEFLQQFAPGISSIELFWDNLRVDPLAPGTAVLAASFREVLTDTAGAETPMRGYFTGVAVHTTVGWRLRDMHWSSAPPTP
jgi:hypothetical protein